MPAQRPCAAFEPISPDLNLPALVESTPNFEYVVRINCDMIDYQGLEAFEKLVILHVIIGGKPLVIEGYHERLDRWTFTLQWLRDNCSKKIENAQNLTTKTNLPLSIGHYLNNMALLTNQWNASNYKDSDRQRIYLKDIDCPPVWHDKLKELMPLGLFYLNDSTGNPGGLGSVDEPDPHGPGTRKGRGVAKAGDLMSSLPPEMRAENMMCYIGHEGTYTPSHREMCASLGQNIMIETSSGAIEDGKPTKPGSSIWFMTESKDRHLVSEYWLATLGHDIEVENHFAQLNAWKAAPFKVHVVEQRVGDFILIPPLAPHQVWNRGTRTVKAAWNRTTVETLEMALNEALPRARMVCRDEQYKNKAIVFYTLIKYARLLKHADKAKKYAARLGQVGRDEPKIRQLQKDFRRLFAMYNTILLSESFAVDLEEKRVEHIAFDSFITCAYCRCNIFNRFLTCPSCVGELPNGEADTYDICMECYAMGRSCACLSKLRWVEQFPWPELTQKHEIWRRQILDFESQGKERPPQAFPTERARLDRRTLAEICQTELKRRPFHDIKKPETVKDLEAEEVEIEVDDNGKVKKKGGIRRSEKWKKEHTSCHICKWRESNWKLAFCTDCGTAFCYGSLVRGFDQMPQAIMENPKWKCPKCLKICPCRDCIKVAGSKPFEPTGTMLGHNTRKIADLRSVESLVDFGQSNINWLKKAGADFETRRLKRRRTEAEHAKLQDPELDENYVEEPAAVAAPTDDDIEQSLLRLAEHEGIPIDPQLGAMQSVLRNGLDTRDPDDALESPTRYEVPSNGIFRKDLEDEYEATEAITFEYPDPDGFPSGSRIADQAAQSQVAPTGTAQHTPAPDDEPEITTQSKKRKRQSEQTIVRNDADVSFTIKDKGQRKRSKNQESSKAADQDNGVSEIQAEESDPSLLVKLKLNKSSLILLNKRRVSQKPHSQTEDEVHSTEPRGMDAPRLSSDLTEMGPNWTDFSRGSSRKARIERVEEDDDFAPRKRRNRAGASVSKAYAGPPRSKVLLHEESEPSDIEEELAKLVTIQTAPKPQQVRRTSKWLEMRKEGAEDDEDDSLFVEEDDDRELLDVESVQQVSNPAIGASNAVSLVTTAKIVPASSPSLVRSIARGRAMPTPAAVPASTSTAQTADQPLRSVLASSTNQQSPSATSLTSGEKPTPVQPAAPDPKSVEKPLPAELAGPLKSNGNPPQPQSKPLKSILKTPGPSKGSGLANAQVLSTSNSEAVQQQINSLSTVDKNRQAKLKAMQWADGEADSLSDSWSASEDGESDFEKPAPMSNVKQNKPSAPQRRGRGRPPSKSTQLSKTRGGSASRLTAMARGALGDDDDSDASSSGEEIPSGKTVRRMRPQTVWSSVNNSR